jgi:hypothetical protein
MADGVLAKDGMLWKVAPADPRNKVSWASDRNARTIKWVAPPGSYKVELTTGRVGEGNALELGGTDVVVTILPPPAPVPPGPTPAPPAPPADPLWNLLSLSYQTDGRPAAAARSLAAVYRQAARDGGTADDASLATAGAVFDVLHRAGQTVAPDPALRNVRRVVADELNAKLPRAPAAPLDAPTRGLMKSQFARMASLLEALAQ